MNKNEVNVNIVPGVRQAASFIGALLGKAYSTVESRACWAGGEDGFEHDKAAVNAAGIGSAGLITNRTPKRYVLKTKDIISAQFYKQPLTGQTGIAINLDDNGKSDMFFAMDGSNPVLNKKPMPDAISDALRGEGDNYFFDAKSVAAVLNEANKAEVKNIDNLITALNKMKQSIQTAIIDNEKKAAEIEKEWVDSKMDGVDFKDVLSSESTSAILNVHTTGATA